MSETIKGSRAAARLAQAASDRPTLLMCAWCGPLATLGALVGMVIIGGYIPPTDPSASGQEVANWYVENTTGARLGMLIGMCAFTLFVPFGVAVAIQTRRAEGRPILAYVQVACVAIAALEGVMAAVIWEAAAFRPDTIDPDITRAIHDLGWFAFLFDIPPFSLWMAAIGIAILRYPGDEPIYPRWLGYLNVWAALLIVPGMLMTFFKTGPFAYNGLFTLYMPFSVFFAWMVLMTWFTLKAITRESETA